jgi:hypothetical protein
MNFNVVPFPHFHSRAISSARKKNSKSNKRLMKIRENGVKNYEQ